MDQTEEGAGGAESAVLLADISDLEQAESEARKLGLIFAGVFLLVLTFAVGYTLATGVEGLAFVAAPAALAAVALGGARYRYVAASAATHDRRLELQALTAGVELPEQLEPSLVAPGLWLQPASDEPPFTRESADLETGERNQAAIRLYDALAPLGLGMLTETQVRFILRHVEVPYGHGFHLDDAVLELLEDAGADSALLELLKGARPERGGRDVEREDLG